MTKEEAIAAMKQGKKVAHRYFSEGEWITMVDGMIVAEDGFKISPKDFWAPLRRGLAWNDDWEIVKS